MHGRDKVRTVRTARAVLTTVAALLAAWHSGVQADVSLGGTGRYAWHYSGTTNDVKKFEYASAGKLFFFEVGSYPGGGPLTTKADVLVAGRVDAKARKLGARAHVWAQLVPWDPDKPPPGTTLGFMDALAEVALVDEVTMQSDSVPLGADIIFAVQPTVLTGSMAVPDIGGQALGNTSLLVTFIVERTDGTGMQVKQFEKNLPGAAGVSSWDADLFTHLEDRFVIVKNGESYRYRFELFVSAGVTPDASNPKSPPRDESYAHFQRTATWGGLADFKDVSGRPLNDVTVTSSIGFDWKTLRTTAPPPEVVEYYNASLDHYFITPLAPEQDNLDAGRTPTPWVRTGETFGYFAAAGAGTSPVCRFYIPPGLGDSHFFGRGTAECDATAAKNPSFTLEAASFIHMILPTAGACPVDTEPVYRVFSNRPDANHRYTTSRAIRDQMVAKGWLAEGDGPDLVVMCAPK